MTARIARLLVGVDMQDSSASAVRLAGSLAAALGATMVAVHAETLDMPAYFTPDQLAALEKDRREARDAVAAEVRAFVSRSTGTPFDVLVEEGPAADVLLRLASAVDLVVVGTRQLHGPKRWWLGSVAEGVVRRSPVPVVVVPPADRGAHFPSTGARILVPADAGSSAQDWVRTFERALHGSAVTTDSIAACDPDRLRSVDLVVVPASAKDAGRSEVAALGHVLTSCTRPVLFVPASVAGEEETPS